jgi:3-oxoacyl-[acyl-carrier-protein] synthase II
MGDESMNPLLNQMERVVVTGMGAITPISHNIEQFKEGLLTGRKGFGPVTKFNTSQYEVNCAAEIKDPDEINYLEGGRPSRLIQWAAREAIQSSGLSAAMLRKRTALVLGTSLGSDEINRAMWQEKVKKEPDLAAVISGMAECGGRAIVDQFQITGPSLTVVTACAAGTNAAGLGMDLIKRGRADRVIVGGLDTLTQLTYGGFASIGALAEECLPFSEDRSGTILGEDAAVLVLERLDLALERNATIYAEILGYGLSNDAHHMTAPSASGQGAILSMRRCLQHSKLVPQDVQYINAHGTSTPRNDEMELLALHDIFGEHMNEMFISSTKSQIGHGLSSAGGIELIATVLALHYGFLPPTAHDRPLMETDSVDFIQQHAKNIQVDVAISNSFAFGGHCASIAVRRWEG